MCYDERYTGYLLLKKKLLLDLNVVDCVRRIIQKAVAADGGKAKSGRFCGFEYGQSGAVIILQNLRFR